MCAVLVLFVLLPARNASAYGVLAHEAVIDAAWESSIAPRLRSKFHASEDELKKARAFAYGGCLIQDLGYYPASSRTFGDLTHYVRSGDFVAALLRDSTNADEYAFALGALAHYASDIDGHQLAVNPSVALLYPKLRAEFGPQITYEQNPAAHLKTEFGFDVIQIVRGSYLPTMYHDFIGFEVSRPVLERAFLDTYGLDIDEVFGDLDLAVGSFRYAVSTMIPQMTKVAWQTKRDEIEKTTPGVTQSKFLFGMTRPDFEREWGVKYDRPGFRSKFFAVLLRLVPKIGPFRALSFRLPTPEAEQLFIKSFQASVDRYRDLVADTGRARLTLDNRNFDTGKPVRAGDYRRADTAYETLLERLQQDRFAHASPALRANLLAFFAALPKPTASRDLKQWQKTQARLAQLRALAAN
ncbi:MAG TPA: zinc dependent phospholipase C family protein [Vicinamibacterales bacterium]|nr:zinc dependent phospholipase C family protein [Vicinamibacterales bacterium]